MQFMFDTQIQLRALLQKPLAFGRANEVGYLTGRDMSADSREPGVAGKSRPVQTFQFSDGKNNSSSFKERRVVKLRLRSL
jgi:hypothetical protein